MSTIADLLIKVRADTGGAESDIKAFGSKVGAGFHKALLPATAALGVMGLVGKVAFKNLQDGAANAHQTEAVIKSTGGAANVTAKHVDDLAMSLRRKAGVDDDVIHSGENMLLTFTNIRNEVGKGNNIFDQATQTVLDMSHALGQDTKSSAVQLGKALNDPIKGITALQRVGVSFTEGQKKQIKTLVDSGHTLKAQKLILHELNREFGGSAENIDPTTKAIANLKLDATDLASSLVSALMPAIQTLTGWLQKATTFMTDHEHATKVVVAAVAGLALGVIAVNAAMKVYAAGALLVRAATAAWTAAQWLLNVALDANPIGLLIIAMVALGVGIAILWKKCETFRRIVVGAFEAVVGWVRQHWPLIVLLLSGPFAPIVALATNAFGVRSALIGALGDVWDWIKGTWQKVSHWIASPFEYAWNTIRGVINQIITGFDAIISGIDAIHWGGVSLLGHTIIPGFAGFGIPQIPHLALGGIVTSPTLALVGEAGPEAVVPLNRMGGLGGVHIENVNVRSDEDIRLFARDLARRLGG